MKEYTQGKLTITCESEKCIHCGNCAKGLPTVFQPKEKPWIKTGVEPDEAVIEQVKKCPSGALGFKVES